jgi:ADP-ribose pyrophosphatase YjhB (NUDIX family)
MAEPHRPTEFSAGGVVVRGDEVVVIVPTRRAANGAKVLALPKGHVDPGETPIQAAAREVREEAGVEADARGELGTVRYWYMRRGKRIAKQVDFYLFEYRDGDVASPTTASARWRPAPCRGSAPTGSLRRRMQVLNFYSTIFADQLKRGRKTATIRLGDKSHKYKKNQAVMVTIGYQHSPREKIFDAVIDQVEVKRVRDLTPRDIEHDNPEFRRHEEMIHFLEQIYGKKVTMEDIVTVVRFSQIIVHPPSFTDARLGIGGAQN